jgi:hypothetical protein
MGKDFKESGHNIINAMSQNLPESKKENHE